MCSNMCCLIHLLIKICLLALGDVQCRKNFTANQNQSNLHSLKEHYNIVAASYSATQKWGHIQLT